jgi:hypothetical protein
MNIDISKLNKAEVLAALYNASKQQGMGFMHAIGREPMTVEQAAEEIESMKPYGTYFDYLHGRVMKVDIGGDELRTGLFDRDNGSGAAARALQPLIDAAV